MDDRIRLFELRPLSDAQGLICASLRDFAKIEESSIAAQFQVVVYSD